MVINHLVEGGPGSGNFGHSDVEGRRGGSAPSQKKSILTPAQRRILVDLKKPHSYINDTYDSSPQANRVVNIVVGGGFPQALRSNMLDTLIKKGYVEKYGTGISLMGARYHISKLGWEIA